jgi:hypothetical protein
MPNPGTEAEHVVSFYRDEACIVDQVTAFIRDGLAENERVVAIATLSHWSAVAARLEQTGVTHDRAVAEGSLIVMDAEELYEMIRLDGKISVDRFRDLVMPLLTSGRRTRVFGELVSLLAERGETATAIEIEALGHEIAHALGIRILCGYQVHPALTPFIVRRIEGLHDSSLFEPAGRPSRLGP